MARNCERCVLFETEQCPREGNRMPTPRKCVGAINNTIEPRITLAEYFFRVNGSSPAIDSSHVFQTLVPEEFSLAARQTVNGNDGVHPLIREIEVIYESRKAVGHLVFPRAGNYALYLGLDGESTVVPSEEILNY